MRPVDDVRVLRSAFRIYLLHLSATECHQMIQRCYRERFQCPMLSCCSSCPHTPPHLLPLLLPAPPHRMGCPWWCGPWHSASLCHQNRYDIAYHIPDLESMRCVQQHAPGHSYEPLALRPVLWSSLCHPNLHCQWSLHSQCLHFLQAACVSCASGCIFRVQVARVQQTQRVMT